MTDSVTVWLSILAFVFRTSALISLLLLYHYFREAAGPVVPPLRLMLGCFIFLLLWVELASVAELIGYMRRAHALVEYGSNWIFVPNLILTVGLVRLLRHLYREGAR